MKTHFVMTLLAGFVFSHSQAAEPKAPRTPKPRPEREFLKKFVGEWECTTEAFFQPGKSTTTKGSMSAHMIGEFWVVIDRKSDMRGVAYHGRATYGFDARKKKYVGTWTDSMAPILWQYEGQVDGDKLAVDTEGPHPFMRGKFKFRNTWEFQSKDLVVLTSEMEGRDGKMMTIMKSTCRRKKSK